MQTQVDLSRIIVEYFEGRRSNSGLIPPNTQTVVLWVVDGLGLAMARSAEGRGLLPKLTFVQPKWHRLLSVFPTTTAAGLASLAFAEPPAVHGALGFSVYLEEIDRQANMLSGLDQFGHVVARDVLYPRVVPTIFERMASRGVSSVAVVPTEYQNSGLSRWLYAGAQYVPYDEAKPAEVVERVVDSVDQGRQFVWIYWPFIDQTAHQTGPQSRATDAVISQWDAAYGQLVARLEGRSPVTILVTADHGMTAQDPTLAIRRSDPRVQFLWEGRWAGERRAITTDVWPTIVQQILGSTVAVYNQQQLWDGGWYGGPPARSQWLTRTLNTLLMAPDKVQFEQDGVNDVPIILGAHGAWTVDEREIPLMVKTL